MRDLGIDDVRQALNEAFERSEVRVDMEPVAEPPSATPPRDRTGGTKRTFPSGALRPSDLVTCNIRGHHLQLGVPTIIGHPTFTAFGGAKHDYVSLGVTRHADGSVTAACLIVR